MTASLFGDGQHQSFVDMINDNKLAVVGVATGAFLGILEEFDQPYEILICVILVLMIIMIVGNDLRALAISLTSAESPEWRKSLTSYVDFPTAVIIMFTTQYATSLVRSEWDKVGYPKSDTIVVGTYLILMFVGFLVFFTSKPHSDEEESSGRDKE
jgi:TRAP-type C4-dicarboxylate transport system permease small subunit